MTYKSIVIGLGNIGMGYDYNLHPKKFILSHCQAIDNHPKFSLLAGVDLDEQKLKLFKKKYKKPGFKSYEKAIEKLQPEILIISAHAKTNLVLLKDILKFYSPSIILLEKPLAINYNDAKSIMDIQMEHNIPIGINYFREFDLTYQDIYKSILNEKIGSPLKIIINYNNGFLNNASHFIVFLFNFMKSLKNFNIIDSHRKLNDDYELDIKLYFENGEAILLSHPNLKSSLLEMKIVGPKGYFLFEDFGNSIYEGFIETDKNFIESKTLNKKKINFISDLNKYQYSVCDNIYNFLEFGKPLSCDIDSIKKSINLFKKIEDKI